VSVSRAFYAGSRVLVALVIVALVGGRLRAAVSPEPQDPRDAVPAAWLDLPDAPFVTKMVRGKAVLVNRSDRTWSSVVTGCLTNERGTARVVGTLFDQEATDEGFVPGDTVVGLLRMVNDIDIYLAVQAKLGPRGTMIVPCPPGANAGLVRATAANSVHWSAEGKAWPK
jgi:hypothetical protein